VEVPVALFVVLGLGAAVFVLTVALFNRVLGPGYGRAERLRPSIVWALAVLASLAVCLIGALVWFRWF
jgi:hypothetical protein